MVWTRKILLAMAALLCVLGVGEAVLRVAAWHSNSPGPASLDERLRFSPFVSDGLLGYRLRPGWAGLHTHDDYRVAVTTNALGMRGSEAPRRKPDGRFRILVLGDSFGFGFGVADGEAFPALLAREWESRGRPIEVLNAAVPGYSFDHHYLYLRRHAAELDPDLVLIAACENDIDDLAWSTLELGPDRLPRRTQSRLRFVDRHGRLQYVNPSGIRLPDWIERPPGWLQDRSHLFNWVRFRIARLRARAAESKASSEQVRSAGPEPTGEIRTLAPEDIARGLRAGPAFRRRYHAFLFDGIAQLLDDAGIPLRVVAIGPGRRGGVAKECAFANRGCLDLSEILSRESFLPNDGHWNAAGHRAIARHVQAWLEDDPALGLP